MKYIICILQLIQKIGGERFTCTRPCVIFTNDKSELFAFPFIKVRKEEEVYASELVIPAEITMLGESYKILLDKAYMIYQNNIVRNLGELPSPYIEQIQEFYNSKNILKGHFDKTYIERQLLLSKSFASRNISINPIN